MGPATSFMMMLLIVFDSRYEGNIFKLGVVGGMLPVQMPTRDAICSWFLPITHLSYLCGTVFTPFYIQKVLLRMG